MRIGIFGGSFDPIHFGHLYLAEAIRTEYNLERVLFIPASRSPFKEDQVALSSPEDRLKMTELAVASNDRFQADQIELERPAPSYTIDTLRELRDRFKTAEFFLILGGDSIADFHRWKKAEEILDLAELIVYARSGSALPDDNFDFGDRLHYCSTEIAIEISSTEIRRRISQGESFRYLIPEPVYRYIRSEQIYLGKDD